MISGINAAFRAARVAQGAYRSVGALRKRTYVEAALEAGLAYEASQSGTKV
jgi:hypothetical protein